jgi:hypothetical protein
MEDNQKDQKTPLEKPAREDRTGKTQNAKPGFKTLQQDEERNDTETKASSRDIEKVKTAKPGKSHPDLSSREEDDNDDQEQRTGEEQDEENEDLEPARRIKTPVAGQHSEEARTQKQNTGNNSRKF